MDAAIELGFKVINMILDNIEQRRKVISAEEQAKVREEFNRIRDRVSRMETPEHLTPQPLDPDNN